MMKFYKESDFSPENMTKHKINYETMFEEIPIVLRNSHLINALLCELSDKSKKEQKFSALDLGTRWVQYFIKIRISKIDLESENIIKKV